MRLNSIWSGNEYAHIYLCMTKFWTLSKHDSPLVSPTKKQKKQKTSGIVHRSGAVLKIDFYGHLASPVSRVKADSDVSGVPNTVMWLRLRRNPRYSIAIHLGTLLTFALTVEGAIQITRIFVCFLPGEIFHVRFVALLFARRNPGIIFVFAQPTALRQEYWDREIQGTSIQRSKTSKPSPTTAAAGAWLYNR